MKLKINRKKYKKILFIRKNSFFSEKLIGLYLNVTSTSILLSV